MDEFESLLDLLRQRGLHARFNKGPPAAIVGGKSSSMHDGIRVYHDGFNVTRESGGWIVRTDGAGQTVNEVPVQNADDVVRVLAGIMGARD